MNNLQNSLSLVYVVPRSDSQITPYDLRVPICVK